MANKEFDFRISSPATLTLEDLWARVAVGLGAAGKAEIVLDGAEKLLEEIAVSQPDDDQVLVKGQGGSGGVSIVSRGGSISIGGGGTFVGGSIVGSRIVTGDSIVIVNGRVVSGNVTVIEGGKTPEMPTISIKVPLGTNLEIEDVAWTSSRGLNGWLDLSLSGQGEAEIAGAKGLKIRVHGQSNCQISEGSGDLDARASGQSGIEVSGSLNDVDVEASGQSQIEVSGSCQNAEAEAAGQSRVRISGVKGKIRKHESGQSRVTIR